MAKTNVIVSSTESGTLTAVKFDEDESDLLTIVRDVHRRMQALTRRDDLEEFLTGFPEVAETLLNATLELQYLRLGLKALSNHQEAS